MQERVNLSPLHWGPKTWFFLESAAIAYPVEPTEAQKTSAKNLLLSLQDLLPCEACRINYANYLGQIVDGNYLDEVVRDRDSLITFITNVHNDVRVRNGQTERSMEEVFNYYQVEYSKEASCNKETFVNNNNKIRSKDEIIKSMNMDKKTTKENFSDVSSDMLYHFNPITLLIGIMIGLIIYKFYLDTVCANEKS